jgi:flagellar biosynthesis/type III secretory pathway chaperone
MNEPLQNFIESLRNELKQYGELLALLEGHQEHMTCRRADELPENVSAVGAQWNAVQAACRERAQRQRDLARSLGLAADSRIGDLHPSLPEAYRLLIAALCEENHELLKRVRQRARHNHILLSRSLELMEQFINSLGSGPAPICDGPGLKTLSGARRSRRYKGMG